MSLLPYLLSPSSSERALLQDSGGGLLSDDSHSPRHRSSVPPGPQAVDSSVSTGISSVSSTTSQVDPCKDDLPIVKLSDTFKVIRKKIHKQRSYFNKLQTRKEGLIGKMKHMDAKVRQLLQRKEELEMELRRIERKQAHVKNDLDHSQNRFSEMTSKSQQLHQEIQQMWTESQSPHSHHEHMLHSCGSCNQRACALTLDGHRSAVLCCALDQHPREHAYSLASGSRDGMIRLWKLEEGAAPASAACHAVLNGHRGWVKTVRFDSHSPRFLLSGSGDHQVRLWDTSTGGCVSIFKGHNAGITCLDSDEASIVSSSLDKTIRCWDKVTGRCVARFKGHEKFVKSVKFEMHAMISAGADDYIRLWDMRSGKCVRRIEHAGGSNVLCYNDDSIISGGRNGNIQIFDLNSGKVTNTVGAPGPVTGLHLHENKLTYSTSTVPVVYQHDLVSNETVHEFAGHTAAVTGVEVAEQNPFLVSSSWDGTLKLFHA